MSKWTAWRPSQDRDQLKVVWNEHKRLGLDDDLASAIEQLGGATDGNVDIIAIREKS